MPTQQRDGLELWYASEGEGEAIFFLHPPVMPSEIFRPQLNGCANRFQVIRMDIRGHGRSSSAGGAWGMADAVEDVRRVLDRLRLKQGHSH
ncbi:alpha/beta hydrolase [Paenibacillus sp. TRM 82003]|nr:alpha/beta hydrolase [Paenibacillus sp. TRM 82003]